MTQIFIFFHKPWRSMPPCLAAVASLSDDECPAAPVPPKRRRLSKGFRTMWKPVPEISIQMKLRRIVQGSCGCSGSCYKPFRDDQKLFDRALDYRTMLGKMTKLEHDQEVQIHLHGQVFIFELLTLGTSYSYFVVVPVFTYYVLPPPLASKVWKMLKDQSENSCRGARHLKIFDKPVCNKGLMKMIGMGKSRFGKMKKSISNHELCPFDMRFTPRTPKLPSKARESVQDFLTRMYNEAAEALPDGWNSNKRPRQGADRFDPKSMNRKKIKHLPHASIGDYHKQCVAQFPELTISRKLFSSAPLLKHWG